jgi:hypothetical protein
VASIDGCDVAKNPIATRYLASGPHANTRRQPDAIRVQPRVADRVATTLIPVLHPDMEFRNVAAGEVTVVAHGREEFRALAARAVTLFASRRQTLC